MENAGGTESPAAAPGRRHSLPTGTRTTPEHGIIRPTTTTPCRFGTKLSLHTCPRRMCGSKLSLHTCPRRMCGTKLSQHESHGPTSGTKLSPLARNGSIWRFFCMQGEFCTVLTTKKPSRESFVPNARQRWGSPTGHQAPQVWRTSAGPGSDKFRMQFKNTSDTASQIDTN